RIAQHFDWRDAVLPNIAGFVRHRVKRSGLRIEGIALPPRAVLAPEAEFAWRTKRKPKHLVELLFVAMPADPGSRLVFGEQRMCDAARFQACESLDPRAQGL